MTILNLIIAIGIPAIVGSLIYIGRKLQVLDDLKQTMEKMKINLKVACDSLIQLNLIDGNKLQTYSPIKITDIGEEYLKKIGFDKIFAEYSQDFFDSIKSERPQTDYDIENAAIRSIYALFDKPYFNPIKDYLYNNPKEDRKEMMSVAGIYVRDKYLEKKG